MVPWLYPRLVARVDPENDTIRRFIVLHYRYDPARRERRNLVLAAFDEESEFEAFLAALNAELLARQSVGEADQREYVSGVIHEPGHRVRRQNQRLLRRALRHGTLPRGWDLANPPDGISVVSAGGTDRTWQ